MSHAHDGSGKMRPMPDRPRRRVAFVAAVAALLLAACAAEDSPATSSTASTAASTTAAPTTAALATTNTTLPPTVGVLVPDALSQDLTGDMTLTGYLVIDQGAARLCAELLQPEPPACGGMSVSVAGTVDSPAMRAAGTGVRWSPFPVDLSGSFSGSKLFAGGPPPQLVPPTIPPPSGP